ncbi:hypothetical protein EYS42_08510 [Aquabacterium lacunae]|uniref:Uncharacterized protein n=1 Tax=Aquabacterium lacunae TaxID=2528630 RepID=A0A4V2JFP0_9BURK|nr:hypothetical protein [Aquabacterium lacunae]TBO31278.1 hypothetical protein EYS42_08510 [Aquabacterium lacunae]
MDQNMPDCNASHSVSSLWVDALRGDATVDASRPDVADALALRQLLQTARAYQVEELSPQEREEGWIHFEAKATQQGLWSQPQVRFRSGHAANAALFAITASFAALMVIVGGVLAPLPPSTDADGEIVARGFDRVQRVSLSDPSRQRALLDIKAALDSLGVKHMEKRWRGGIQIMAKVEPKHRDAIEEALKPFSLSVPPDGHLNLVFTSQP